MITVVSYAAYAALKYFIGAEFSGWLLVLPVLLDLTLIGRIGK